MKEKENAKKALQEFTELPPVLKFELLEERLSFLEEELTSMNRIHAVAHYSLISSLARLRLKVDGLIALSLILGFLACFFAIT